MIVISAVWAFVRKEWKLILLCFIAIYLLQLACNKLIDYGFNKADAIWIEKNNKQVKQLNDKIADLEATSRREADRLKTEKAELTERLNAKLAEGPKIILRDVQGKPLKCDGKEVIPYLGNDFSEMWNSLNEEGAMK